MSIVSNPYTFSITSNKTFKTDTLTPSTPGARLGPYRYELRFLTRTNGYNVTIDNTSSKYLSVEYDCWRIDFNYSNWKYTLYLANGTTDENYGELYHSDVDPDPECSLIKIS